MPQASACGRAMRWRRSPRSRQASFASACSGPAARPPTRARRSPAARRRPPTRRCPSRTARCASPPRRALRRSRSRPLRIAFADAGGNAIAVDDEELGMGLAGTPDPFGVPPTGDGPRLVKRREPGERFFGCGERTAGLEKTGSHQVFWNVDPPAGHTASLINLYTSIPFAISLREGRAHGLLLDSTHRVEIDLALADPERVVYEAAGGDLVYYVILGPTPRELLDRYTRLTGRTPLPPLWALGNQQSRWSYMDADEVRAHRRRVPRPRHPVRRPVPRHRLHGRLPGLHLGPRALPGPRGVDRRAGRAGLPGRDDRRPGREGRRALPGLRRGPRARLLLPHARRRRVPQRRLARHVRVPGLHRPRRARVVGRPSRGRWSTPASPASGAT